jgi:hypothetical protein
LTRRTFLLAFAGLFSLAKRGFSASHPEISDESIMRGLLEALIPDDSTPGAKEAQLYEKLVHLISQGTEKKQAYKNGLQLVRKELQNNWNGKVDWDAVLWQISRTSFFSEFRRDALRLFYSDSVGWKLVKYKGPPLIGYPDYHKCRQ